MINSAVEIAEAREALRVAQNNLIMFNPSDPSNYLDEEHKDSLLESLQKSVEDAHKKLNTLLQNQKEIN